VQQNAAGANNSAFGNYQIGGETLIKPMAAQRRYDGHAVGIRSSCCRRRKSFANAMGSVASTASTEVKCAPIE
jgi:hypothetical protein